MEFLKNINPAKSIPAEFRFETAAIRFSQDFAAEKSATVGKEQIKPMT
jgi:hypothetical protein